VFRCFLGHREKTISILVELHSKRKEDSFLCMKDIRSINVELTANQDMFFPFLCMSGRHVIWENTFSTPNSGEHSTRHLQHNAAKAAGKQLTKAEQQLAELMDSTSPSFLPLRVPPFKASKSRPAAKLLDSRYM